MTTTTPRVFFGRGTPTYVVGTSGDEASDRAIAAQVEFIRSNLSPAARTIADTEIPKGWPPNPIVYGGAHVNAAIAALELPFTISAGTIVIGGQTFTGDGLALITVVPAKPGKHPEFLLFAGTGTPGIAEINSGTTRVEAPIIIADAFGPWISGSWQPDGTAKLDRPLRRVGWRETKKSVAGEGLIEVAFRFYEKTDAALDGPAIDASVKGLETAMRKLGETQPVSMTVYVHPDQRSKKTLTGDGGAGHAVPFAKTLHVFYLPQVGGLEPLVAHEGTHLITSQRWPPGASALLGEGIAVWTSGVYAGVSLAEHRKTVRKPATIRELLGPKFRAILERDAYVIGGTLIEIAVEKVGLANVRDHLYGATAATWDAACKRAGTTADALEAALDAAFAK